ncbi:hypothetical protein Tco_0528636 [Tanacetum coccineum]
MEKQNGILYDEIDHNAKDDSCASVEMDHLVWPSITEVEGDQTTSCCWKTRKYTPGASGCNTGKQTGTVICYNAEGEDSHPHNVLIKPMFWMLLTPVVMNSNSSQIALRANSDPGMAQMHSMSTSGTLSRILTLLAQQDCLIDLV